jgi:phosphate transport system protein
MATMALEMLRESLAAFVERQPERARAIIPRDSEVDQLNAQLHRVLLTYMMEKPETISRALHVMVVSKCLERIADHATNIAEEVVYLYEAKDIRHVGLKR